MNLKQESQGVQFWAAVIRMDKAIKRGNSMRALKDSLLSEEMN